MLEDFRLALLITLSILVAAILGVTLVVSAMRHDRLARPVERTGTD